MQPQNEDRRRLDGAARSEREQDLEDFQEAMEECEDAQVRQELARRVQHLMIELETGYSQPFDGEED